MFSKLFIAALFVNNVLCYYLNRKQAFIVYETSDFYVIFNAEKDTANYFGVSWANGQSYCQKKYGTDLATVDTAEKQKQIDDVYLSDNNYYAVWIGLYANGGKYSFKDGTQINGYTNWKPGFPRSSASGRCVMNYGKNNPVNVGWYGWADWSCGENSANYVCNKADVGTANPTSMPTEAVLPDNCDFKLFKMYKPDELIDGYTYVTKAEIGSLSSQIINQYNNDGGFKVLKPINTGSCCLEFSQDWQQHDGYSFNGSPFMFIYSTVASEVTLAGGSPCTWGTKLLNPNRLFKVALGPHPATKADTLPANGVFGPGPIRGGCTGGTGGVSLVKNCALQDDIVTDEPTAMPTSNPSGTPSKSPTKTPSKTPSVTPTDTPTESPSGAPTPAPTDSPTPAPTDAPTPAPTDAPTPAPTDSPTPSPTSQPTPAPTDAPTPAPTDNPTTVPTLSPTEPVMLVDNVCELLDIDFFLNTCSLHHNGLKTKIGENDAKDVVLTARVTALETKVSTDKTETNAKISALQTQITNLKNTVQSSFQALATSLGNLGSSAKSVPIFNIDGEIVGQEKLLFTTLQAQYLIILSLLFNALLIVGIILYCCIINGGYSPKKRAYNHVNNFDSSDSEAISH